MKNQQTVDAQQTNPYLIQFRGSFVSMLRWHQLDKLWATLREQPEKHWYVYAVGDPAPEQPLEPQLLNKFLTEVDALLRRDHEEDYCGIVYADTPESPSFIKIYDPNNLGVTCGFSDNPPLPGWVLSLTPPCDLQQAFPPTAARRRWWQRLFPA